MIWISDDSVFNIKSILSEQSKAEKNCFCGKIVTLKLARVIEWHHHTWKKISESQKLYYNFSNQIASFNPKRLIAHRFFSAMTRLGSTQFWIESQTWKTWKKFAIESRENLKVRGFFPLRLCWWVCCWRKKINVELHREGFLVGRFCTAHVDNFRCRNTLRFFEIFDIRLWLIMFPSGIVLKPICTPNRSAF